MAEIKITADVQEVLESLNELGRSSKANTKYMLTAIGREGAKIAKKSYRHVGLKKGKEQVLYKSITSWMNRKGTSVYVGPKRKKNTTELIRQGKGLYQHDISYGYMLAHGYESNPKNHVVKWDRKKSNTVKGTKYMKFLVDDHWVTMHRGFKVGPYDFVEGPVRRWMSSPMFRDKLDTILEKRVRQVMDKQKQDLEANNE